MTTKVNKEIGAGTFTSSAMVACFGIICLFIPCCMDSCKDSIHLCTNCGREVGIGEYNVCWVSEIKNNNSNIFYLFSIKDKLLK